MLHQLACTRTWIVNEVVIEIVIESKLDTDSCVQEQSEIVPLPHSHLDVCKLLKVPGSPGRKVFGVGR